jgi:hypothetical protein
MKLRLLRTLLFLLVLIQAREVWAAGKVEDLSKALLQDSSFKVRTQAALLLGKLGDKAAVPSLVKALEDESKTVRAMAAQSLAKLGSDSERTALRNAIQREEDSFAKTQMEKALAAMPFLTAPPPPEKDKKVYLKIGLFSGGTKNADTNMLVMLRGQLKQALERVSQVVIVEGPEERILGKNGRPAFLVDGNILRLDEAITGSGAETKCEVKVMVARLPSRSVILWTSAGAAVTGGKREREKQASRQDCIEASATQLGDSLAGYFKTQGT